MRDLLTLYKLLWEQIKGEPIEGLFVSTGKIEFHDIINRCEMNTLELDIIVKKTKHEDSKEFVQRRIKELENKE